MIDLKNEAEVIELKKRILAGRYRLDRKIAEGGFGVVFKATQLNLDRAVAVKVISHFEEEKEEESAKERFMLEAATLAKLVHPNVVTIHDYGEAEGGELFIVMEYLDGQHLDHVVQMEGPLAFRRIIRIAVQIARALRAAHASNVVHRDLKPANIMLVRGDDEHGADHAKVLDFGLVKRMDARGPPTAAELTESTSLLGTPKYMAPEQICGEVTDARTDLYSLGCVLYYLCAGVPPFDEETKFGVVQAHLTKKVESIGSVGYRRPCHGALEKVIVRCLEKSPSDRYASVDELIADLKHAYLSLPAEANERPMQALIFDSGDLADGLASLSIRSEITDSGWMRPERPLRLPTSLDPAPAEAAAVAALPSAPRAAAGSSGWWIALASMLLVLVGGAVVFSEQLQGLLASPRPAANVTPTAFGSIRLESAPPGAHVFVNGEPTGQLTPARLDALPIGATIGVRLEKKGFAPYAREVLVESGEKVEVALTPIPAEPAARSTRDP